MEYFMLSAILVFNLYIQPNSVPERALKQVKCTKRTNEVIATSELLLAFALIEYIRLEGKASKGGKDRCELKTFLAKPLSDLLYCFGCFLSYGCKVPNVLTQKV